MSGEVSVKKRIGDAFELDAAFELGDGVTVLGGPSGSGKTTLLRLIAGILTPDEGRIIIGPATYFDSADGTDVPVRSRRVGFVFQDYALFPHLTAEQNVAYGIKNAGRAARAEKSREMLEQFHVGHIGKRLPREMSGGEQQRVALARALASDPAIVLLDEPLSAVDVETRTKLLTEIETAQRRARVPFIYVTHNHAEAERIGDRRVTLRNGRLSAG